MNRAAGAWRRGTWRLSARGRCGAVGGVVARQMPAVRLSRWEVMGWEMQWVIKLLVVLSLAVVGDVEDGQDGRAENATVLINYRGSCSIGRRGEERVVVENGERPAEEQKGEGAQASLLLWEQETSAWSPERRSSRSRAWRLTTQSCSHAMGNPPILGCATVHR